jgi:hypothetical protein
MEPIEVNGLEYLVKQTVACDGPLLDWIKKVTCQCLTIVGGGPCPWGHYVVGPILTESLMAPILTEGLKACGGEFYVKCPGFERLERVCDFEPAIEAAKWKEKVQLDRIAQLEARVQELELKRKG